MILQFHIINFIYGSHSHVYTPTLLSYNCYTEFINTHIRAPLSDDESKDFVSKYRMYNLKLLRTNISLVFEAHIKILLPKIN